MLGKRNLSRAQGWVDGDAKEKPRERATLGNSALDGEKRPDRPSMAELSGGVLVQAADNVTQAAWGV